MKSKRCLKVGFWMVLCGLVFAPLASAAAEEAGYGEGGKVYAVQKKGYQLKHELYGAVGVLPMDAMYKGVTFGGGYTYHFSHHFAWEAVQFLYSANIDTGLKKDLRTALTPRRNPSVRSSSWSTATSSSCPSTAR